MYVGHVSFWTIFFYPEWMLLVRLSETGVGATLYWKGLQMLLHYLVKLQCFKTRINSKKDVILKYFCGCTCLISFSRQRSIL